MPLPRVSAEESKVKKRERDQRYLQNTAAKQHKRELNRRYYQRKKEQALLQQHPDPLARLADIVTQQGYLEVVKNYEVGPTAITREEECFEQEEEEGEEEVIDVTGIVVENGNVLEIFDTNSLDEGFDEGWHHHGAQGFNDEVDYEWDGGANEMEDTGTTKVTCTINVRAAGQERRTEDAEGFERAYCHRPDWG